jgi:hypothetical protein
VGECGDIPLRMGAPVTRVNESDHMSREYGVDPLSNLTAARFERNHIVQLPPTDHRRFIASDSIGNFHAALFNPAFI